MKVKAELMWYLAKFASVDATRPHMQTVHFDPIEKGYRAVSSDGHRMTVVEIVGENIRNNFSEHVSQALSILTEKNLVKACKPGKYSKYLEVGESGIARVTDETDDTLYVSPKSVVNPDQSFPAYRQVVPDVDKPATGHIMVDPRLLEDYAQNGQFIYIYMDLPTNPIALKTTFQGWPVLGIVMPGNWRKNREEPFPSADLEHWKIQYSRFASLVTVTRREHIGAR